MSKPTKAIPVRAVGSLAERAMITQLAIGRWYGTVTDPRAAHELAQQKRARAGMVSLRKKVLSSQAMVGITSAINEVWSTHRALTLPWADGGFRILAAEAYFTYMDKMRAGETKFWQSVDAFLPRYTQWYEEAKTLLGDLMQDDDYPAVEQLRGRFYFTIRITPLPQAGDFRVAMAGQDVEAIRSQIEQQTKAAIAEAMREPWVRLHQRIKHLIERLKSDGAFHGSNIQHLRELLDTIPLLNVIRDPQLNQVADAIRRTLLVDPEAIRSDSATRNRTADEASEILGRLAAFI